MSDSTITEVKIPSVASVEPVGWGQAPIEPIPPAGNDLQGGPLVAIPPTPPGVTVAAAPVLLKDKIAANPEAFDFSDIPIPEEERRSSTEAGLRTLEAVLGLEMKVKPASPYHPDLYFKPIKIRDQRRVMEAIKEMGMATDDIESLDILIATATSLLYVPNPDGDGFYQATTQQVEAAFEAFELMTLIKTQCGMRGGETGPKA